jgi:hypothetical protein
MAAKRSSSRTGVTAGVLRPAMGPKMSEIEGERVLAKADALGGCVGVMPRAAQSVLARDKQD